MGWFWGLMICLLLVLLYCLWQNNALTVSRLTARIKKADGALDGDTIAQISDLHNKSFGHRQVRLLRRLRECGPDLIVLTGDLVDSRRTNLKPVRHFLAGAVQIAPVYYVTGNHEHRLPKPVFAELLQCISDSGAVVLDNRAEMVKTPNGGSFCLLGVFDKNRADGTLEKLCGELPSEKLKILLIHRPHAFAAYEKAGVDLAFCGHAHGGQWRLPGLGGIYAPDQGFWPKYTAGCHKTGTMWLTISRGLGNSLFPIRLHNRPEIVLFTLKTGD